jgi:hypothetical protein
MAFRTVLAFALVLSPSAFSSNHIVRADTVVTLDGIIRTGNVQFDTDGSVRIGPASARDVRVPWDDVLRVTVDPPLKDRDRTPAGRPDADADGTGTGLHAAYFAGDDSTKWRDPLVTRIDETIDFAWGPGSPDKAVPSDFFGVRWTGMLRAPGSGRYRFYGRADGRMTVWLDGKRVLDAPSDVPCEVQLERGRSIPIRVEYRERTGDAVARLEWESAEIGRQIVPESALFPTNVVANEADTNEARTTTRLLTRDGSELAGVTLVAIDDVAVKVATATGGAVLSLPVDRVARIALRPLTEKLLAKLPAGSSGVLLRDGDFFDGHIYRAEGDRVSVDSPVLGSRTFPLATDVVAIVLQDPHAEPATYSVTVADGSTYMATSVTPSPDGLRVVDSAAGEVRVAPVDVREIVYGGPRVRRLTDVIAMTDTDARPPVPVAPSLRGAPPPRFAIVRPARQDQACALNGKYARLLVTAGVPTVALPTARVRLVVVGDGRDLFRSPPVTSLDPPTFLAIDVTGVRTLILRAEPFDDVSLPVMWAEPTLVVK